MGNGKLAVAASDAKFGKTLLGGFQVIYPCPRCRQELITKDEAVTRGDNCPHCKAAFGFDDQIRTAFLAYQAEKQSRDEKKKAAQAEKEKLREAREIEQARLAAEALKQHKLDQELQRSLDAQQSRKADSQQRQSQVENARNVDDVYGCLMVILSLGGIGVALVFLASFALFSNASPLNDNASLGGNLLIVGVSAAVSLTLVYVFFRILRAMHSVLVLILDRLNASE